MAFPANKISGIKDFASSKSEAISVNHLSSFRYFRENVNNQLNKHSMVAQARHAGKPQTDIAPDRNVPNSLLAALDK